MNSEDLQASSEKYTFQQPYSQSFSLPYPITSYIIQNPTSNAWQKMIQTCKCIFSKHPAQPVQCLSRKSGNLWFADGELLDVNKCHKLFLKGELHADIFYISFFATYNLIPKIYKCHVQRMELFDQILAWDQYQILTSAGTLKRLQDCTIKNFDETKVIFNKLIEHLHLLEYFKMNFYDTDSSMFEPDTSKKVTQTFTLMKNLRYLYLCDLPENFDLDIFKDFIMKNVNVHICLYYTGYRLSYEKYGLLVRLIDEINENQPAKVPHIQFPEFESMEVKYAKYQHTLGRLH